MVADGPTARRSVELVTIYFAAIIVKSTCLRDNKTIELV